MIYLKNIGGIRENDRERNTIIRKKCCYEVNVMKRVERDMLKGSGEWREGKKGVA